MADPAQEPTRFGKAGSAPTVYPCAMFTTLPRPGARFTIGTLLLVVCLNALGRCGPSATVQTSLEILSCEDRDPNSRSRLLGYGAILEVRVLSRKDVEGAGSHRWWPANDPLPKRMKVFYDKPQATCSSLAPGVKRKGTLRWLCCDGAEPRCNFGTSVALYDGQE